MSLAIPSQLACSFFFGGRTPGSQTPGVPATPEPSMMKNSSSSRAHLALNVRTDGANGRARSSASCTRGRRFRSLFLPTLLLLRPLLPLLLVNLPLDPSSADDLRLKPRELIPEIVTTTQLTNRHQQPVFPVSQLRLELLHLLRLLLRQKRLREEVGDRGVAMCSLLHHDDGHQRRNTSRRAGWRQPVAVICRSPL